MDAYEDFFKDNQKKNGYRPDCKECVEKKNSECHAANRPARIAKIRQYGRDNKEKLAASAKIYREQNKETLKTRQKIYILNTKLEKQAYDRVYRKLPERIESRRARHNRLMRTDVQFKLQHNLRGRLHQALNNNQKVGSAVRDLGCSISELKSHLESKFQLGMSWGNHGKDRNKWHIDHIIPLSKFDLTDRQHLMLACHYLNLQPLWEMDNLSKGNRYTVS